MGAVRAEGRPDAPILFTDPLAAAPRGVDAKALLRISALRRVVIARNAAAADFAITPAPAEYPYEAAETAAAPPVQGD